MTDCLFCAIASGDKQTELVYEDDDVIGFKDINPQAPHHILFVPRKHVSTLNDLNEDNAHLMSKLYLAAKQYASEQDIADTGWRAVMNCNKGAGQSVFHIHLHLLAGRSFSWPPG